MGPMGPMGPMMGGSAWGTATLGGAILVLAVLFALALGLFVLAYVGWGAGSTPDQRQPRSPAELLRERYARGELTPQQYRVALVDVLKDRYVRSELEIDEYEALLDELLREPRARVSAAGGGCARGAGATDDPDRAVHPGRDAAERLPRP